MLLSMIRIEKTNLHCIQQKHLTKNGKEKEKKRFQGKETKIIQRQI